NASDITRSSTMNVAAENGHDPPGVLQSLAEPRHRIRCLEVEPIRPHQNLKWRMVGENRNRLGGLGVDQFNQTSDSLRAKVTLVARTQGIQRNQSYRVIVNRIVDEVGIGREISGCRKGRA